MNAAEMPDDHNRQGAVSRDPDCHACAPHPHHLLPCDRTGCACQKDLTPGVLS